VKQSGGHIWVQSEMGVGTRFVVCLPEIASVSERIEPARGVPSPGGKGRVLIVEDQAEVRELACRILTACGYQVTQAANGADALRIGGSGQEAIDLLLTDVIMPGKTGPELASRLKSLHPQMKVLFMSGYSDLETARKAGLASEGEYLQKPFLPNVLAKRVRDILGPAP
jgi:DNA-binding NtrC family response regulator